MCVTGNREGAARAYRKVLRFYEHLSTVDLKAKLIKAGSDGVPIYWTVAELMVPI
jgi:hypothetical protein